MAVRSSLRKVGLEAGSSKRMFVLGKGAKCQGPQRVDSKLTTGLGPKTGAEG